MFQSVTPDMTLREISACPLLKDLFPYFVFQKNWSEEELDTPLNRQFGSPEGIASALNRVCALREKGRIVFPLYDEEETDNDPSLKDPRLVFFPSKDPSASQRPYILVVPGGGYVNVWSFSEGFPIANRFNQLGWHVFVLTYRVNLPRLFPKPLQDIARALELIRKKEQFFHVSWDNYCTVGFSAGANLILSWMLPEHGYKVFGLPSPKAIAPVYPPVSLKMSLDGKHNDWLTGAVDIMDLDRDHLDSWSIEDHVSHYPPTRVLHCADDDLVDPEHSRVLKKALDEAGVPSELEIGEKGGHGFAEGTGTDVEGWIDRTSAFFEKHLL